MNLTSPKVHLRKRSLASRWKRCFRSAGALVYGVHAWTVFACLLVVFAILSPLSGSTARTRRLARFHARLMFFLARMPVSILGLERLPQRPHVLLVNHTSFLDAIVLTATLPGYTFTTRQEFTRQRLLCPPIRSIHTIVLKHPEKEGHTGNVEVMAAALRRGENLVIFPEGRFCPEPGLLPFHSGAFAAAMRAGVPVVVAGLRGARAALRLGTWLPKRSAIVVEIGPTLMPPAEDAQGMQRLMADARAAMASLSGEYSTSE